MKRLFLILIILFLFAITMNVFAQTSSIDSMIILNTGTFKPTIVDANKISSNPVVNDSTPKLSVKPCKIFSQKLITGFDVTPIVPAQMVGEPLTKLYNALAKVGFGNYATPYLEVWYNSLRSKEYSYGIRTKHLSSSYTAKGYGLASLSNNEISLYGKKFLKEHTLLGNFDYTRNACHFYGYNKDLILLNHIDVTKQVFNYFGANAQLTSHYTNLEKFNHDVNLSYYNLSDQYKSSENNIKAKGYVQTKIAKELLKINGLVDFYNYKTAKDTINNTLITINPNFIADGEKYHASIGVTATMDVFTQSKFYFYPNLDLSYNVVDNIIIPYVGAAGGLQKNSFKKLTDENPFVLSDLQMKNTNRKYELFGGLKGTLSSNIVYNARASYSSIGSLAMYVNDTKDLMANRFNVIYDDAEELNVRGEVSYQNKEKLLITLSGDYYNYKMKTELRAWYMPQVKIALSGAYNLRDKIIAKVNLFYLDNQYSKITSEDNTLPTGIKTTANKLSGLFDVNLGAEYRYTKNLGFYANFNNIANTRYFKYSNYPTQKFNCLIGLSYSF